MNNKLFAKTLRLERPAHELSRTARYTRYVNPWPAYAQWLVTGFIAGMAIYVFNQL